MSRDKKDEPANVAAPDPDDKPSSRRSDLCVVGVGASAGGVDALRQMLGSLGPGNGMAHVLILHMPAQHHSSLSEILSRECAMAVCDLTDGMRLEADRVYVLPPAFDAELDDGVVKLTGRTAATGQHRPVDHFLHSLAEHYRERAIGVILSGTASDGSLGVQEIKAAGGITFAQDGTAEQTSMPRSAIQTGAIDFVLSPADIAKELARIARHPIISLADDGSAEVPDLDPVLEVLRDVTGVDFAQYKRNTLYRRIARRIVLHKLEGIAQYVKYLQSMPAEAEALYQDILINVTSFFRNPEAFEALKAEVFPAITNNRSRHDPVRIWVLGCSTGEEAYSLAMAFAEFVEGMSHAVPLQVFATDLNPASIDKARSGLYSHAAVAEINPERLRRFFFESSGGYRIAKSIRDACVFARHNVLTDPPFSRVDLVSCRNMLIYLGVELQKKVIPILNYALRPNGYLWLGTSETIGVYRDLFDLKNTRYKIYAKNSGSPQLPPAVTSGPARMPPTLGAAAYPARLDTRPFDAQKEVDRLLVARYAPPSVLIRADLEILQYRGNTSPYLAPMPGRASLNLLKMLREGLVLGVRAAIQTAKAEEVPVRQEDLLLLEGGTERRVNVEVIPVKSGLERADMFMIVFEDAAPPVILSQEAPAPLGKTEEAALQEIARLKQELTATREYVQSVVEQHEAANEELQSANEEVQSANEELQSINEELETSKEEVQSSNEELATVNDELYGRNVELAQTNNDLLNLLSSVQMAIVMLGANLRIRRFTPMAERLLNLIPTDVGRPVSDIKTNFDVPDLEALITEAIDSISVREREVQDRSGRWYLLRVRPYRTLENKIDGAVVILVDVDSLKRSQEMLRQQTELLNQAHEPIIMWEVDGGTTYWNKAAEETYGFTADQALGRTSHDLLMVSPPYETYRGELVENGHWSGELVHTRRDGQKIIVESRMVAVTDTQGRKLVVEANRPITQRKESERILRGLADNLVTADRHKDEFLAMLAHELRNPLAPLRNVVSVLQAQGAQPEQKARALGIMGRQIGSMARLIDDLLDVSRMTLSQIELRRAPVDMIGVVRRAVEQAESWVADKGQSLHLDLVAEALSVDGDAVRLEQIVCNLIQNASKYTAEGGDVWVSAREEGGEIVIAVRDNGIGIETDKLPHVFDLFMRATRSIDQAYGGLGIGLTLARRFVELHGGVIEARSDGLGKGSEFVVRLPRTDARAAEETAAPQRTPAGTKPRRILVVDDSHDNAEAMAMSLRLALHEVEVANSGADALERVNSFHPDAVVIDIGMPEMDGYELAKRLRADGGENVKLVGLSGYGHAEARRLAQEAGFDEYFVKPASVEEIVATLGA